MAELSSILTPEAGRLAADDGARIFAFCDFSMLCGEENFPPSRWTPIFRIRIETEGTVDRGEPARSRRGGSAVRDRVRVGRLAADDGARIFAFWGFSRLCREENFPPLPSGVETSNSMRASAARRSTHDRERRRRA